MSELKVRLVPDLSAAALRRKETGELSTWYRLRYISSRDYGGSGSMPFGQAIDGLMEAFRVSRSTAYRGLTKGEGNYWRKVNNDGKVTLHLSSLENVARHLNTNLEYNRHFRELPVEEFAGSIGQTRSQLYASTHKPRGIRSNPISRASITDYTGLAKQQQRRYEIQARVTLNENSAVLRDEDSGKTTPELLEVYSKNKSYIVQKLFGNTFHSAQAASSKGMLRKVHRALRLGESLGSAGAASDLTRRFFVSVKNIPKLLRPDGSDRYSLIRDNLRAIRGRSEWARFSTAGISCLVL